MGRDRQPHGYARRPDGADEAAIATGVDRCGESITALGLPPPARLRPPLLAFDARVERVAGRRGLELVLCDLDPRDWEEPGADAIVGRVRRQLEERAGRLGPGATLMLHDGRRADQTVAALPRILRLLGAGG